MANPNFSVEKDVALSTVNCETAEVGGDLTVGGAIRPGTFTNRVVNLNQAAGTVLVTNLTPAQSGTTFVLLGTGAQTINLPVLPALAGAAPAGLNVNSSVGMRYAFHVGATVNAGSVFIINSGLTTSQDMVGAVASSVLNALQLDTTSGVWGPAGGAESIMTMDGTDRGGIAGSYVEFEAVASQATGGAANACWRVSGRVLAPANAATTTPFS